MRDNFDAKTKDIIAQRVGYRCSNPKCRKYTTGPQEDTRKALNIGVAAHISGASKGGPRYDPQQTSKARRSSENGIWLCQNCAKLIDNDENKYNVSVLKEWRKFSEEEVRHEIENSNSAKLYTDRILIGFYSKAAPEQPLGRYIKDIRNITDWQVILDEIKKVKEQIDGEPTSRKILVDQKSHLTIGFMVGYVFRGVSGIEIFVKQEKDIWGMETPEDKVNRIKMKTKRKAKLFDKSRTAIAIIDINRVRMNTKRDVIDFVKTNKLSYSWMTMIELTSEISPQDVNSIVRELIEELAKLVKRGARRILLFCNMPLGLAIFLGTRLNSMPQIHLFEYNKLDRSYRESFILQE